jgi:hypothetical protein
LQALKRGFNCPNEGFVQRAVEVHFGSRGFSLKRIQYVDVVAVNPVTGEQWWVEAKGISKAPGVDFHTGLGQILVRMGDSETNYGLAIPAVDYYLNQCAKIPTGYVND